jgi:hypothetical protein
VATLLILHTLSCSGDYSHDVALLLEYGASCTPALCPATTCKRGNCVELSQLTYSPTSNIVALDTRLLFCRLYKPAYTLSYCTSVSCVRMLTLFMLKAALVECATAVCKLMLLLSVVCTSSTAFLRYTTAISTLQAVEQACFVDSCLLNGLCSTPYSSSLHCT